MAGLKILKVLMFQMEEVKVIFVSLDLRARGACLVGWKSISVWYDWNIRHLLGRAEEEGKS